MCKQTITHYKHKLGDKEFNRLVFTAISGRKLLAKCHLKVNVQSGMQLHKSKGPVTKGCPATKGLPTRAIQGNMKEDTPLL